ncbi:MAG: hypothetical protein WAK18_03905 [Nocardioidaceae bacterium]
MSCQLLAMRLGAGVLRDGGGVDFGAEGSGVVVVDGVASDGVRGAEEVVGDAECPPFAVPDFGGCARGVEVGGA